MVTSDAAPAFTGAASFVKITEVIQERCVKYQALYRTYRPRVFDDVKGQDVIVRTLRNQVKTGRIAHAYLFCGSRGTGKTTCAKIMAQAVNCLHPVDGNPCLECESCRSIQEGSSINVIEMDAASRNGVDDFRRIIEEIAYPPSDGKKKVYIIDEVHMLSSAAFNAFLKTLEEPPEYAVFILATTDPQKLLPTVLSRCQRFDFRRIPVGVIEDRLREVFKTEGIEAEEEAVHSIARRAEGGMRDALSIADRCVSFFPGEKLTGNHILEVLGTAQTSVWRSMLNHAVRGEASGMIRQFDDLLMDGKDVRQIVSDFTWYLRDLLIFKASAGSSETDNLVEEDRDVLYEDACKVDEQQIMYYIEVLSELTMALRNSANRRVLAEIALINLCRPQMGGTKPEALQARIARLEKALEEGGSFALGIPAAGSSYIGGQGASVNAESLSMNTEGADGGSFAASSGGATIDTAKKKDLPRIVVPELFQRIAAQWKLTMGLLKDKGRSVVLAEQGVVSYSREEPDTLFIRIDDNWFAPISSDQSLLEDLSETIGKKYGVKPRIRVVNKSSGTENGLTDVSSTAQALKSEGIDFDIDIETEDPE